MRRIFVGLLLLSVGMLTAQANFPKTPTKFLEAYRLHVLKTASDTQKVQLQNFEGLWTGEQLTPFHKKTTMRSIQHLYDRKQTAGTMLQATQVLVLAKNKGATEAQLDTLVQIFDKTFEKEDPKKISFLLKTLSLYIQNGILYKDPIVTVYAEGGGLDFSLLASDKTSYDGGYNDSNTKKAFDSFDEWDTTEEPASTTEEINWDDFDSKEPTSTETTTPGVYQVSTEPMPYLDGGLLKFNNINLKIVTALDTIIIQQTSGKISLLNGEFVGKGGTTDWSLVGKPEVKASLKDYHFSVTKPELLAEDVSLSYTEKVDETINGIYEYKYQRRKAEMASSFPRFMSYQNNITIKNMGQGVDYKGGFALSGAKIYSSCVAHDPSMITVSDSGKVKFKAIAPYYELNDSIFESKLSKIIIYLAEKDSITHPGVQLKYNTSTKDFFVRKDKTKFKEANFINSYHGIEMEVDQIDWNLSDSIMTMRIIDARQDVPAYFKSDLQYTESDYIQLKSFFKFHPLQQIVNYMAKTKKKVFSINELAEFTGQKDITVRGAVTSLQNKGFVKYDQKNYEYSLSDKGRHFYNAKLGREDYDDINIKSLAATRPVDISTEPIVSLPNNAVLRLDSNFLVLYGVDEVILSDSNKVLFKPKDRTLTLKEDRAIEFDGTVITNNYIFNGTKFLFDYKTFTLDLAHIDSIEFSIEVYDSITGKITKEKLDNKLSYSQGVLFIDEPNNKSGLKSFPKFPHFDADQGAAVLFNKKDILNGVYDTTFRYNIPPFSVDSLSGAMESTTKFEGEFISGGVFPTITQNLEVLEDKGFGFVHKVPEKGYPIYNGLATFYGTVSMGKKGLRGDGKIVFLNTTLESMDFVFYKDSVVGLGEIANTKPGTNPKTGSSVTFPEFTVTDYEMRWNIPKDSMIINNYDKAFQLYQDEAELNGTLILTTKGLKGRGVVETHGSLTISNELKFNETTFSGSKSQFELLTNQIGKPAVRSDFVEVHVDLKKQLADFSPSKEGLATNDFPFLKYKTTLNNGFWDIKKRVVVMEKPATMKLKDSYFVSTKKSQDSLGFSASKATYYIDSLQLNIEGVEKIQVADALVYPFNNKLQIQENAKIKTLNNATIVMDTVHQFHTLVKGDLDINSKTDLDGRASYRFVNFAEDTLIIKFSDFKLEAMKNDVGKIEYHTVARGAVLEEDTFLVAPQMLYKGEVSMFSHKRLLALDGYIKLDLNGAVKSPWMRYENSKDVDDIRIDLESQENKTNLDIITGIHYNESNQDYYTTFLGQKQDDEDRSIFLASGYLIHDLETKEFEVVDKKRLIDNELTGNLFGYIEEKQVYDFNGKFDLLTPNPTIKPHYTFTYAGAGLNYLADSSYYIHGLSQLTLEVPPQVVDALSLKFDQYARHLPGLGCLRQNDSLYHDIAHLSNSKDAQKYAQINKTNYMALNKVIKSFANGFVFNDLKLHWNKQAKAWHSEGKIGLVNIASTEINKYVKGYFELKKGDEGDLVNLYLELSPELWYCFRYADNALFIHTSDPALETFVTEKNTEAKNLPRNLYYWTLGEEEDFLKFKSNFVTTYLGGKDVEMDYSEMPADLLDGGSQPDEFEELPPAKDKKTVDPFEEEFEKTPDNAPAPGTKPADKVPVVDEFETSSEAVAPVEDTKKKGKKEKSPKAGKKEVTEEVVAPAEDEFADPNAPAKPKDQSLDDFETK
jgi:DNA-binding transcriptional regulator YhcF (GntR family)